VIIRPFRRADASAGFTCGESALDVWFAKRAWSHERDGIARVYVLEDPGATAPIVGVYSLSSKSVETDQVAPVWSGSLPRFPLPVTYVGCFAVAVAHQGRGHGRTLMGDALARALLASIHVGSVGVFLHAKTPRSTAFYATLGFVALPPLVDRQQPMFLAMETLRGA